MEDEDLLCNSNSQESLAETEVCGFDASRSVTLSWHNINVFAELPKSRRWCCWGKSRTREAQKQVLINVSGSAEPGSLLGIMGASGAGKTTLLNVLTGRSLDKLKVHGVVMVNGRPVQGSNITRLSGYVQQEDLFIGTLTVREHLIFQAHLRLDSYWTHEEKLQRVDDVLQELGLSKCSETLIGIPGRVKGISGGEMKRLAFASEVLTQSSLLFCDEPTSGLDSFMAYSVVSVLKEMAAGGQNVICTIHQPSSEIFALFDRLLLMADGRVAFLGDSRDALEFFARQGMRCPLNYNPGDYFISKLAIVQGNEEECRLRIKKICDYFERTRDVPDFTSSVDKEIEAGFVLLENSSPVKFTYKANWFDQMRFLLWRCSIIARRERLVTVFRFFQTLAIAFIICLVYGGQKLDQNGVANLNGAIFLLLTNLSFQNTMNVIRVFSDEYPIFLREHWSGLYSADTYFLSKTLSELPVFSFLPALLIAIVYWCVGFYPDIYAFFLAVIFCILVGNAACSFGYMISGITKTGQIAGILVLPTMVPLFLFGGFFLRNNAVPPYFEWLKNLSWFYYANEALCVNQWKDIEEISCGNISMPCLNSGSEVLEVLNFDEGHLYSNMGFLVLLIIGYRLLAFLGILFKSRKRS